MVEVPSLTRACPLGQRPKDARRLRCVVDWCSPGWLGRICSGRRFRCSRFSASGRGWFGGWLLASARKGARGDAGALGCSRGCSRLGVGLTAAIGAIIRQFSVGIRAVRRDAAIRWRGRLGGGSGTGTGTGTGTSARTARSRGGAVAGLGVRRPGLATSGGRGLCGAALLVGVWLLG